VLSVDAVEKNANPPFLPALTVDEVKDVRVSEIGDELLK